MLGIFITLLTFVLILVTLFMCLVVLMQRPNTNAGMGAAFGGGVTESTFGAETTNVLTRATKWSGITFFVLALVLYALYLVDSRPDEAETLSLPEFAVEETPETTAEGEPSLFETAEDLAATAEDTVETAATEATGVVETTTEELTETTEEMTTDAPAELPAQP